MYTWQLLTSFNTSDFLLLLKVDVMSKLGVYIQLSLTIGNVKECLNDYGVEDLFLRVLIKLNRIPSVRLLTST